MFQLERCQVSLRAGHSLSGILIKGDHSPTFLERIISKRKGAFISDARWTEIDEDVPASERHVSMAVSFYAAGGFEDQGLADFKANMAFMPAMQSGHTTLETDLVRTMSSREV